MIELNWRVEASRTMICSDSAIYQLFHDRSLQHRQSFGKSRNLPFPLGEGKLSDELKDHLRSLD